MRVMSSTYISHAALRSSSSGLQLPEMPPRPKGRPSVTVTSLMATRVSSPSPPGSGERQREVRLHGVSAQVADEDAERGVALAGPRERELLGRDRRGDGDRARVAREADVVDADVDAPRLDSAAGAAVAAAQASARVAVGEGLARVEADRASDVPRPAAAGERAVAEREGRAAEREEERRERDDEGRRGLPGHLLLLVETAHLRPA